MTQADLVHLNRLRQTQEHALAALRGERLDYRSAGEAASTLIDALKAERDLLGLTSSAAAPDPIVVLHHIPTPENEVPPESAPPNSGGTPMGDPGQA